MGTFLETSQRKLAVRSWALNRYKEVLDGQWQCNLFASDGSVYFASSTHSAFHGACFFRYDPRAESLTLLCEDMTRVCGEDPAVNPQGKLHSPLVEADGWLYTATHFSNDKPGVEKDYTGAHVIGYEIATGRFRDFGVAHPNYTIYSAVDVDRERKALYVYSCPIVSDYFHCDGAARVYRFDIPSGRKQEVCRLDAGAGRHVYWFCMDRNGGCWFTADIGRGTLYRIRPESGRVDSWKNAAPRRYLEDREVIAPESQQDHRWWRWAQTLPDGERIVFSTWNDGMLWLFDSTKSDCLSEAFRPVAHIGPASLGMTLAGNRVYYVQRGDRLGGWKGLPSPAGVRLFSVGLDSEPSRGRGPIDHGVIVDQDLRQPHRLESLSADGRGRVFMTGDWFLLPGEKGTLRYNRKAPDTYDYLGRGQFFAVADVSKDLA